MRRRGSGFFGNLVRALGAVVVVAILVVGVPLALVMLVGNPLPTVIPSWDDLSFAIRYGRIDSWTQIKGLAVVAWLAWANLAGSFLLESLAALRGSRARSVRSLAATQWLAARLVAQIAMASSLVLQSTASVAGALPPLPVAAAVSVSPAPENVAVATLEPQQATSSSTIEIGVGRLDTLWGLAETHLGSGEQWRVLRDANVGRTMVDGTRLGPDFTTVKKDWTLLVPASGSAVVAASSVEVTRGDNLWNLSEQRLQQSDLSTGPADVLGYLDQVVERNEDHIVDPDLIYPGQVLAFPAPASEPGPASGSTPAVGSDELHAPNAEGPVAKIEPAVFSAATEESVYGLTVQRDTAEAGMAENPAPHDDTAPVGPAQVGTAEDDPVAAEGATAEGATAEGGTAEGGTAEGGTAEGGTGHDAVAVDGQVEPEPERLDLQSDFVHIGSVTLGAGGALLAAGALQSLRRRRRYRLAHRSPGRLPVPPDADLAPIERALNRQSDPETADWIRAALASLAARPVWEGEAIAHPAVATFHGDYLEVEFEPPDSMAAPLPWATSDRGQTWHLPRTTTIEELPAVSADQPVPTLVTLGVDHLVNLEALGVLSVVGYGTAPYDLIRSIVHELATSPAAGVIDIRSTVSLVGTEAYGLVRYQEPHAVESELLAWLDDVEERLEEAQATNAFALRLLNDGDPLGPVVCVLAAEDVALAGLLLQRAQQTRLPLALLVIGDVEGAHVIELDAQTALFSRGETSFEAQLLSEEAAEAMGRLLADATDAPERPVVAGVELSAAADIAVSRRPSERPPLPVEGVDRTTSVEENEGDGSRVRRPADPLRTLDDAMAYEPEVAITVRVLGEVTIDGLEQELTSQQLSILGYLACHGPVSRSMLIDALWDGQMISQSRLPNLLTELRARVGRQYLPEAREGRYELVGVATDLARFERGVRAAQGLEPGAAVAVLRPILELVRGVPFTPPSRRFWSWVADESHLAARVEAVVADAALRLAGLERGLGNPEGAQWACERGLLASPTDESLVVALTEIYVDRGKPGLAMRLVEGWEDKISRLECGDPSDQPRRRLAG